jgi:hypothetical protein
VGEREYIRETKALLRGAPPKLAARTVCLLEQAEAEARARDDNHVGTEHLVLGLYALGESYPRTANAQCYLCRPPSARKQLLRSPLAARPGQSVVASRAYHTLLLESAGAREVYVGPGQRPSRSGPWSAIRSA